MDYRKQYDEQAQKFLVKHSIVFQAVLIGSACPMFCADAQKQRAMNEVDIYPRKTHIHGKHYRCTFTRANDPVSFSVDFWNSYAAEEQNYWTSNGRNLLFSLTTDFRMYDKYKGKKPVEVTAYDVLSCIQKSDPGTFENFCLDFGYNTDSRKAEIVYHAVVKEWQNVQRFFKADEIEELQDIN